MPMSQKVRTLSIGGDEQIRTFRGALDEVGSRLVPLIGRWSKSRARSYMELISWWLPLCGLATELEGDQHTVGKLRVCSFI